MKKLALLAVLLVALCGCTQNQMARNFGGNAEEKLPPGKRFLNVT